MSSPRLFFLSLGFFSLIISLWSKPVFAEDLLLPIGDNCSSNSQCTTNDCEDSDLTDSKDDYCDCSVANDCAKEYGTQPGEIWECVDGTNTSHDLDYCQSNQRGPFYPIKPVVDAKPNLMEDLTKAVKDTPLTEDEIQKLLQKPMPRIKIPGLTFSDIAIENLKNDEGDGIWYLYIPFLSEYIAVIYKYLVLIVGILAVVLIIVAGLQWALPDASGENITAAKKRIQGALVGLVIAVSSYTILYTINPELVTFRNLRVRFIPGEPLPDYDKNPDDYSGSQSAATAGSEKIPIGDIGPYKNQGCGKNLVELGKIFAGQTICQGPCHCANFVSRILALSGCDKSFLSDSAPRIKEKLMAQGWEIVPTKAGVQPGDVVFWGKPDKSPGHVAIATSADGEAVESGVDMRPCWQGKAKEIENACGSFWHLGYYGGEKKQGQAMLEKFGYSGDTLTVKQQYSQCVAKFNVCPPWGGTFGELCGYCQKIGPATEFFEDPRCVSRQCIQIGKANWSYYLKNPLNK